MSQNESFEQYLSNTVLNFNQIESNRKPANKQNSVSSDV